MRGSGPRLQVSNSFDQGADSSLDRQTQTLRRPARHTAVLATFTQTQSRVSAAHTCTQQLLNVDLDAVISHSRSQIPLHAPTPHLTGSWGSPYSSRNSTDAFVNTLSHTHTQAGWYICNFNVHPLVHVKICIHFLLLPFCLWEFICFSNISHVFKHSESYRARNKGGCTNWHFLASFFFFFLTFLVSVKQGNYWVKQKNKTNSDLIWEYVLVCDPWPASEVGIWCVFTALLDWVGRNGSRGWHLQAESEARLILVCSIFLTPSTGMDVDVTVVILAVTETLTLTFRKRPPPTRIPPHGPFW